MKLFTYKSLKTRVVKYIENKSFTQVLTFFLISIFTFALIYLFIPIEGHGITCTDDSARVPDFWDSLYFSVITISSLGYGDMHPNGFSRFLSMIEVLMGLALMGLLISKLTSARISFHVKRLYISDSNRQLNLYWDELKATNLSIRKQIDRFAKEFSPTPAVNIVKEKKEVNIDSVRMRFENEYIKLDNTCASLKSYLLTESENSDFFQEISSDVLIQIANTHIKILESLKNFLITVPDIKRSELLIGRPGKVFKNILSDSYEISEIVLEHEKKQKMITTFSIVKSIIEEINSRIMIISVPIHQELEKPNLQPEGSNDPQSN